MKGNPKSCRPLFGATFGFGAIGEHEQGQAVREDGMTKKSKKRMIDRAEDDRDIAESSEAL